MSLLETKNLCFRYPQTQIWCMRTTLREWALTGIDFKVEAGTRLAIMGSNGSGKSTLMQCINGLLRPTSGTVYCFGKALDYKPKALQNLRQLVGFVFQDPDHQIFANTVYEDISFGPINLGMTQEIVHCRTQQAMQCAGLDGLADLPVSMLSYGQRKLLALAGIFAMNPQLLLLDEPTSGLDYEGEKMIIKTIDNWLENGKRALIFSTHDVDLAYRWATECLILSEGKILKHDTTNILENASFMQQARMRTPYCINIHL